jgi:hypothetical protein
MLYGDSAQQQQAALTAPDPTALPWITTALARLSEILADLANPAPTGPLPGQAAPPPGHRCPDQCRTSELQVNCPGKRRRSDNDQQLTAVGVMLLRHHCGSPGPAVERIYEPQFGEGFGQPVPVVEVTAQR